MNLIIFIHGALSTKRSFNYIADGLHNIYEFKDDLLKQNSATVVPNEPWEMRYFSYDITKEPGAHTVRRLVTQLDNYTKTFPIERLVLIGHSFGGVLAVDAVRRMQRKELASVITMATPFGGSGPASLIKLIKLSKSQFLENVGSYEPFFREFVKKKFPCRVRKIVTVEGTADIMPGQNDGVVSLESQLAMADDPMSSIVKVKLNHFEVLLAPEVTTLIIKELNREHKPAQLKAA